MKFLIVLALFAVVAARPSDDDLHYDSKYDSFNVQEIINNIRLLTGYTHCFIGSGKCTAEGKDFKKWIPEGTKSSCGKCTDKQKVLVAQFIKAIMEKLPEEWETLKKQADPNNEHQEKVKAFVAQYA